MKDSRYVRDAEFDKGENDAIGRRYNAMTPEQRECGSHVIDQHMDAVFEQCKAHQCGRNIGGGCAHIAGYSTNTSLLSAATDRCAHVESVE